MHPDQRVLMSSAETTKPQVLIPHDKHLLIHLRNGKELHLTPLAAAALLRALSRGDTNVIITEPGDKAVAYLRLDAIDAAHWIEPPKANESISVEERLAMLEDHLAA